MSVPASSSSTATSGSTGGLEVVDRHPLVVLDGAHNPDAARALAEALAEAFVWRRLHLVIGVLETKDVAGILAPLAAGVARAYAAPNANPKSLSPEAIAEAYDLILVTGSLYTVADARPAAPRST